MECQASVAVSASLSLIREFYSITRGVNIYLSVVLNGALTYRIYHRPEESN